MVAEIWSKKINSLCTACLALTDTYINSLFLILQNNLVHPATLADMFIVIGIGEFLLIPFVLVKQI